jgi:competence protein ComEC
MTYFKRPLVPIVCVYIAGLWLGRSVPLAYIAAVAGALGVAWLWRRRESSVVILLLVMLFGAFRAERLAREQATAEDILERLSPPISAKVAGRVAAIETADDIVGRFVIRDAVVETEAGTYEFPGGILVTLIPRSDELTTSTPDVGQLVELEGRFDAPKSYNNFFVRTFGERLALQRIYATLHTSIYVPLTESSFVGQLSNTLYQWRKSCAEALRSALPGDEGRWLISLLFNDRRVLQPNEVRWLRDSNMFHLFAVSGLHVGAYAAVILLLARALRFSWPFAWLITLTAVWAYVGMIGQVPSALRAATMLTAYGASSWCRREIDPLGALILACLILLILDPTLLWQAGFLLSAGGVLGIVTFYPILSRLVPTTSASAAPPQLQSLKRLFIDSALVTLSVTLLLLPAQLYFFHQINILSPLANVAGTLLAGPLVAGGMVTLAASFLSSSLAAIVGAAVAAFAQLLVGLIELTAEQTWAILRIPQIPLFIVFAYYLVLATGYYLVPRDTPEFIRKARARLTLHALGAVLLLVLAVTWIQADRRLKLWFLDVGQGDSILVQLPTGQTLLVDTGNAFPNMGRQVVIPHLQALGIFPLDYLLVTHLDSDHCGSVPTILEEWNVRTLVVGNDLISLDQLIPPRTKLANLPRVVRVCAGYKELVDRDLELQVFNPDCSTSTSLVSDNDRSVVLYLRYKNFSALLTGDAEEAAESSMIANEIPRCDVLKVAHHGSSSSSSERFLAAVQPQIAIISCGKKNIYGHPAPAVVERLRDVGARIYRTDRHGAILVATDGNHIEVETAAR